MSFERTTFLRGVAVLTLCLALLASCQNAPRHGLPDEEESETKSVFIGELIAIFPGLLWHGLGHRYAGDVKKAQEMEMIEAYGLLAAGAGAGIVFAADGDEDLKYLEISGWSLGGLGGLLFVGSWIYDIIYTPSAVARHNARVAGEEIPTREE